MLHDIAFVLTPEHPQRELPVSELPVLEGQHPLAESWNAYRCEVGQFLAEGREGQFVVIDGKTILGFWNTSAEALEAGYQQLGVRPFLVHQVKAIEQRMRVGWMWRPGAATSPSAPRA